MATEETVDKKISRKTAKKLGDTMDKLGKK